MSLLCGGGRIGRPSFLTKKRPLASRKGTSSLYLDYLGAVEVCLYPLRNDTQKEYHIRVVTSNISTPDIGIVMTETANYITIHRKILEWGWYSDLVVSRVFEVCLLKANWKDGMYHGQAVKRGQLVTSLQNLSSACFVTIRQLRTALKKLKSTGEIKLKTTNKYTLITIVNYDTYQQTPTSSDKPATSKRQTDDKRTTTIEEGKEGKKGIHRQPSAKFTFYGENENVPLTPDDYKLLVDKHGHKLINAAIQKVDDWVSGGTTTAIKWANSKKDRGAFAMLNSTTKWPQKESREELLLTPKQASYL